MRAALVALLCGLGLAACGGEAGPVDPSGAHLSLAGAGPDGTGTVELAQGQEVALVAGAQGGFHVWLRVRATGLSPGPVTLERRARRVSDDALVLRASERREMVGPLDDGVTFELPDAMPSFMCPSPVGVSVVDTEVRFEVELTDEAGQTAHGEVTLVPRCPDDAELGGTCQRICTG